jgi:predicted dehydrogenase
MATDLAAMLAEESPDAAIITVRVNSQTGKLFDHPGSG